VQTGIRSGQGYPEPLVRSTGAHSSIIQVYDCENSPTVGLHVVALERRFRGVLGSVSIISWPRGTQNFRHDDNTVLGRVAQRGISFLTRTRERHPPSDCFSTNSNIITITITITIIVIIIIIAISSDTRG